MSAGALNWYSCGAELGRRRKLAMPLLAVCALLHLWRTVPDSRHRESVHTPFDTHNLDETPTVL
jgi:hypothetical protein